MPSLALGKWAVAVDQVWAPAGVIWRLGEGTRAVVKVIRYVKKNHVIGGATVV